MTATHRLAAILAADVAGYSRLMGADGEGTLGRLKAKDGRASQPLCRGTAAAASLWAVVSHQLVGESPISQAVGVQFELIAPPQHVSAFDDRQLLHKPSRIAEGRGDRRGLDQLRQVHSGLPAVL